jgi:hypothetical protein
MLPSDVEQISHVAWLAVFALVARRVASAEFSTSPEVHELNFSVKRGVDGAEPTVELFFVDAQANELGGMAL